MLTKGQKVQPEDRVLPEEEIKDPFVLEFLDLKDEYSETDQVKHGRCMDCPRPIHRKDLDRLMLAIRKSKPRERLLFTLLAETGLRINEALSIYVEDIVLSAGQEGIRFRGKGEYEREIPLPFEFESLKLLRAYLHNEDLTAGPLFRTGKYKDQRMSYRTALYQWTKLCEQAEVKCEIHQLRHTAATEFVNSGVSIGTVRRLLGHRNLQTTQRYAELSGETVRHELDAFARRKTRTR